MNDKTDIREKVGRMRLDWGQTFQNKSRRTLICLCVDASVSMSRDQRMEKVDSGIDQFLRDMDKDVLVRDGLEVCLVAFGNGAEVKCEFGPLAETIKSDWHIVPIASRSEMGAGVMAALERLDSRIEYLSAMNISYYVPWLILISDGDATDKSRCEEASEEVRRRVKAERLKVKCLKLGDQEDGSTDLQKFTLDGQVDQMDALRMMDYFTMLSRKISIASRQSIQRGDPGAP